MGETAMTSSAHSPNSVLERYTLSRTNCSIGFEIGNNVVLHMSSHDEDESARERDSSNVRTKTIMNHNCDVRNIAGRIITTHDNLIGFRSINENIGETVNVINLHSKARHRFKEHGGNEGHSATDIAFAQHRQFFAVLDEESSLFIYQIGETCESTKHFSILNWPTRSNRPASEQPRISWCPYMPSDDDDEELSDDNADVCHVLAIYAGRHLHVVDLGLLKESANNDEVDFEHAKNIDGAIISLTLDDDDEHQDQRIVSVCISPDCTAVAVAKSSGPVAFYIIEQDTNSLKFAHMFDPRVAFGGRANTSLSDLIFLDDLREGERKDAPFWRSCVAVSNGGRQIALFECQTWKRLGRIRFESPRTVNDFVPIVDPSAQFVHFLDIDGSNVYSVEIFDGDDYPRFVGVTQTSFFHPIYAIAHVSKNTFESDNHEDDIFNNDEDDDEDDDADDDNDADEGVPSGLIINTMTTTTNSNNTNRKRKPKTKRYFVAMGKKSMQELQITLKQQGSSRRVVDLFHTTSDANASKSAIASIVAADNHDMVLTIPQQHSSVDEKELGAKLDDIVSRLEKMEIDRKMANDRVIDMINGLDDQMRQRESYLLNRIEQVCENNRLDIISVLRNGNGVIQQSIECQNDKTSEYVSQRVGSSVRSGLQEVVVPTFERSCDALFERLNEQFRAGLSDYLTATSATIQTAAVAAVQLAAQSAPVAPTIVDSRTQILQLLKNSPELAFETALNTGDPNLLEFVCARVNPDTLFSQPNSMSQPVLVSLLQQLTLTLAHERDLKYRYIEHILPAINVSDTETMQHTPNVASQLLTTLQDIIKNTNDDNIRRHTRLLFQLTRSTFYQSPHPARSLMADLHTGSQNSPM